MDVALSPGGIRAFLTWRPFSLSAFRLVRGLVDEGLQFATVIDVGANVGQFSRAAVSFWPDAQVLAFEPLPACAEQLQQALGATGRVQVQAVAIGRLDGTTAFHPHEYTLSSSVLPVTAAASEQFGWAKEKPPIDVPVRRLDTLLAGRKLARPTLLKVDVQGFELEVLRGAPRTLDSVDALVLEVAFQRSYEDQAVFTDVYEHLAEKGWRLIRPLDARREHRRMVELDCLFRRAVPGYPRPAP